MTVKTLFTKRVRRIAAAALASAVTTFVGLQALSMAEAQTVCSLQDATEWQLAVTNSEVELTPTYLRTVTEAFLNNCPERPEFRGASRVAGIAAADLGDAEAAARHFRNAGPMRDQQSNFYAVAVHLVAGHDAEAWAIRDQFVGRWADRLDRNPLVTLSRIDLEDGTVYRVHIPNPTDQAASKINWVAVPSGPGWPATLTFTNDNSLLGMRSIRVGTNVSAVRRISLNRCYGRRSIGRLDPEMTSTQFDGAAIAGLTAYLANPDLHVEVSETSISPCYMTGRLLPTPVLK